MNLMHDYPINHCVSAIGRNVLPYHILSECASMAVQNTHILKECGTTVVPKYAPRTENALTGALRTGADAEDFASDENPESSPTD